MSESPLRERLVRLGALQASPPAPVRPAVGGPALPPRLRVVEDGPTLILEGAQPLARAHGRVDLGALRRLPVGTLTPLSAVDGLERLTWEEVAFFDTETSGLAGGVGTYAFLVGVGYLSAEALVVRQFFLRDYGREEAMLQALQEFLSRFRGLVSFNGKTFDLPVLAARCRLARLPDLLGERLHLDLLHAARRLWRYRLASCSLSSLEAEVLSHLRREDIPSAIIPDLYLDYLRRGDLGPLRPVFSHNLEDVLSLAALAAHLCQSLDGAAHEPQEHLALGDHGLRSGRAGQAEAHYRQVLAACPGGRLRRQALQSLALLYRRQRRWDEAMACWQELAGQELGVTAHVELAKLFEHRTRELERALQEVRAARGKLLARAWLGGRRRPLWLAGLDHRRQRLERKLGVGRAG